MTAKYSYRDLGHPNYHDALAGHNSNTLKLVHTVAEFAHKISLAHENFANEVLNIVETFKKRNIDIRTERPVECPSSLSNAWEILLQETQYDAQAHADAATLLMKNVYTPLTEISTYKKSQSKKLHSFRDNFDKLLTSGEDGVLKCHAAYIEAYQSYRTNSNSRDALHYMAEYHNSHNDYLLQIRAANQQQLEYHQEALPYLLEELEDIYIDLANTLNGAIESHALLLLTKANEQSRRFDSILKICKQVNPKNDVHHFVMSVSQDPIEYLPQHFIFNPPSDPNIPGSELGTMKDQIVNDRFTEAMLREKTAELQKEAGELTSYLKQNQDITHTLTNVCQRNLANHLYAKVYETQEDLCRKRNEIRIANLQLAAIRAQIELLSPKHNGNSVDGSIKQHNKSSIKGMWKKAFRTIRSHKPKDGEKDKTDGDRDSKHSRTTLRTFRRQESTESSESSRQSSLKRVLRRKDSKEDKPEEEYSRDEDPVYMCLKRAASIAVPSSLSGGSSEPGSLDIVDEELEGSEAPYIRASSSSYRSSYHEYQ